MTNAQKLERLRALCSAREWAALCQNAEFITAAGNSAEDAAQFAAQYFGRAFPVASVETKTTR